MSKKRPSNPVLRSAAHWSSPAAKAMQEYCRQASMPAGAIKADLSKQAPHNSYGPPMWYVDQRRKCKDCGKEFNWAAKKQQHWFEVLKIPIHVQASRCATCARKVRMAKAAQKSHTLEMAQRPRHPNEAFFKPAGRRKTKSEP